MLHALCLIAFLSAPPTIPAKDQLPPLKRSMVATEAFAIAEADAATLTDAEALFTRYIRIKDPTPEKVDALKVALNQLSLASDAVDVKVLAGGAVVRISLSAFAPRINDLQLWLDTWELLQFDPDSAQLLTRDQVKFLLGRESDNEPKVQVRRLKKKGDKVTNWIGQEVEILLPTNEIFELPLSSPELEEFRKSAVVRFNGPHIDPLVYLRLQQRLGTLAPVVNYEYFLQRGLSTIRKAITKSDNDGVFETVYGGLYYRFAKVRTAKEATKAKDTEDDEEPTPKEKKRKRTDLDQLFVDLGLGENADKLFEDLRSDIRTVMQQSEVTGKNRVIVYYPTPTTKPGRVSVVMFTIDLLDTDIDNRQRHLLNLLKPTPAAFELLWITANGLWKSAVFDGQGNLLDQVAQDIAADRTVPAPHTPILQPAIGCMSCHVASGSSLFIDAVNELPKILKTRGDIFADLGDRRTPISDTLDRLKFYAQETDDLFTRGRDDLNRAVLRNTFKRKILPPDELTKIGQTVTRQIVNDYNRYRYGDQARGVSPTVALGELGFVAENDEQAVKVLNVLLPPNTNGSLNDVVIEDPIILALLAGLNVPRSDWDLRKSYASFQSQQALLRLPKGKQERLPMPEEMLPMPRPAP